MGFAEVFPWPRIVVDRLNAVVGPHQPVFLFMVNSRLMVGSTRFGSDPESMVADPSIWVQSLSSSRGLRFFLLPGFPHCFRGLMTFGQGWKARALLGASHGFPLAFNRRRRAGFGR